MLQRGMAFGYSSVLLRRSGGDGYVCLHLLCQSIEIVLKALLLLSDFNRYEGDPLRDFGHKLEPLVDEVLKVYKLNPLKPELLVEFRTLDALYRKHRLRYEDGFGIFVDPSTIPYAMTFTRLVVALRLLQLKGVVKPDGPRPSRGV